MPDINKTLKRAIDGPAPQHKVRGQEDFEFSEGSDGALHAKIVDHLGNLISNTNKLQVADVDVKAELEQIKQQQQQILQRLDGTFNTQLTGSLTEYKEILLANSIAITDTNYHHYDGGNWDAQTAQQAKPIDDFNKYKYRRLLVINSLDQPLDLELLHNLRASYTYDNLRYGLDAEPQTVTLPNKGQYIPYVIDANIIHLLDGILGGNVTVRVRSKVAPTTGSLRLSVVMWN